MNLLPERPREEGPEWEAVLPVAPAEHGVPDDEHLVHVKHDPERVAEQEEQYVAHEDDGQVVLLPTPGLVADRRLGGGLPTTVLTEANVLVDLGRSRSHLHFSTLNFRKTALKAL